MHKDSGKSKKKDCGPQAGKDVDIYKSEEGCWREPFPFLSAAALG